MDQTLGTLVLAVVFSICINGCKHSRDTDTVIGYRDGAVLKFRDMSEADMAFLKGFHDGVLDESENRDVILNFHRHVPANYEASRRYHKGYQAGALLVSDVVTAGKQEILSRQLEDLSAKKTRTAN